MVRNRHLKTSALLLAAAGAVGVLLTGCGGATTNGSSLRPTVASGPIIYGLQASGAINSGKFNETSGLASADAKTGYVTGATAYTGTILQAYGSLPLGFAPGGQYINDSISAAATPGASVIFGAAISNGNNTTQVIPINPSSVVLTSSEIPSFSEPLTFIKSTNGPLANATYRTAAFSLPFTTTGLHSLTCSVADTSGQTGTTTFATPVLAGNDAAVVAQIIDADGNPVEGATATIDGADAPGYVGPVETAPAAPTDSVADTQGMVILFAPAGAHTVNVTSGTGDTVVTGTAAVTLTAGQAYAEALDANGKGTGKAFTITVAAPAAAPARRSAK